MQELTSKKINLATKNMDKYEEMRDILGNYKLDLRVVDLKRGTKRSRKMGLESSNITTAKLLCRYSQRNRLKLILIMLRVEAWDYYTNLKEVLE